MDADKAPLTAGLSLCCIAGALALAWLSSPATLVLSRTSTGRAVATIRFIVAQIVVVCWWRSASA